MENVNRTRFKEIFEAAVELPAAQRAGFLSDVCSDNEKLRGDIERLIAADEAAGNFLESSPFDESIANFNQTRARNYINQKIGAYKIEREIGAGGMGTVFLAARDLGEISQQVAVKIVHQGAYSNEILRRFLIERKILAELEHSGIARLIDAGQTIEGLPFLVMEYVDGVPLDEFCRSENCSMDERLRLFRQICAAVAYAHRRLIIHRDLKPSNILVTKDGEVKLLDFGIAKLLSPTDSDAPPTATLMNLLTPAYAAPEQIRGDSVTTATDVYSLGVILYELLTGVRPFSFGSANYQEIVRVICETEPPMPSSVISGQLSVISENTAENKSSKTKDQNHKTNPKSKIQNPKSLRGDLDNIILKALRKNAERRYQAVEQFGDDLERYQKGLPVSARADTFSYRAAKFFERNKLVVSAASLIILILVSGIIGIAYQYTVANRERALAEKRFTNVKELANKVVFHYHDEIAKFSGSTALRGELAQDAVKYLDDLSADELDDVPLKLELARAYQKIGDVQGRPYTANLGKSEDALASYQKSVSILEKASAELPAEIELKRELVRSYLRLFSLQLRLRLNDNPENTAKALNLQLEINAADQSDPIANAAALADAYIVQADQSFKEVFPDRIAIYQKAADLLENIPNKTSEMQRSWSRVNQRIGTNYMWLGDNFLNAGDAENAAQNYRKALPYNEKMFESVKTEIALSGTTPNLERNLAGSYRNLGENHFKMGERENSLNELKKCLEISLRLAKNDAKNTEAQIDVANAYISLADAFEHFGDVPQAVASNEKCLEIYEKLITTDEKNGEVINGLVWRMKLTADLLEKVNRTQAAKNYRQKVIEMCKLEINDSTCKEIGTIK